MSEQATIIPAKKNREEFEKIEPIFAIQDDMKYSLCLENEGVR